jgi:hypothetical protein
MRFRLPNLLAVLVAGSASAIVPASSLIQQLSEQDSRLPSVKCTYEEIINVAENASATSPGGEVVYGGTDSKSKVLTWIAPGCTKWQYTFKFSDGSTQQEVFYWNGRKHQRSLDAGQTGTISRFSAGMFNPVSCLLYLSDSSPASFKSNTPSVSEDSKSGRIFTTSEGMRTTYQTKSDEFGTRICRVESSVENQPPGYILEVLSERRYKGATFPEKVKLTTIEDEKVSQTRTYSLLEIADTDKSKLKKEFIFANGARVRDQETNELFVASNGVLVRDKTQREPNKAAQSFGRAAFVILLVTLLGTTSFLWLRSKRASR